nr:alpha-(1,6)-fucosyltransferase-like [Penaeus vannamei]
MLNDHCVTQYDLWRLRNESGLLAWKAKELKELSALIQHRFHVLQNPADCKTAKKIICNIPVDTKSRGIGSQLHHLSYCFLASYGQQRTLIINSGSAKGTGLAMDAYYLPLSETCVHANGTAARWPGKAGSLIVQFPNGDNITPRHPYFPKSVPKDIGRRLVNANADPFAWWMGQFFRYAMRTASGFRDHVEKLRARLGFESPIVGVQVRRTDKVIREAKLIELEKYMEAAEDFFDDLEIRGTNVTRRRIYLATDDPNVVLEARKKYPNYKIVCNEESVSTANMKTRKSETNMKNFLTDVFFLYHSDYLVCSLSSNICRLAYELLQTLRPDAPRRIFSVDSSYWFHYEVGNVVRARYPHTPRRPSELEFQKGDRLTVIFKYYRKNINHQDGFLYGQNQDTGQFGLYPIYKTVEITRNADIPSFEHIDKKKK